MLDLIAIEPEIVDAPDAKELAIPKHAHGCSIEFRNVSFSYVPERTILHNVSFKIKAGRTLAIVGSSGRYDLGCSGLSNAKSSSEWRHTSVSEVILYDLRRRIGLR